MADEKRVRPLPERKESFARKQAGLGRGISAAEPRGSGPPNRHGMPKLPPGQRQVSNWPVLDLGVLPRIELAEWRLEIDGSVEHPMVLDWEAFLRLPQTDDVSDFHCVTTWSQMDLAWRGVRFRDLMERVVPRPEAAYVSTTGYDVDPSSGEAYTTNLSLDDAMEPDVLLVHTVGGAPLPPEHGGPCRMITPRLYAWKGAKWIRRITLGEEDRPGFWERRGYSNTAYPWYEDRYNRG